MTQTRLAMLRQAQRNIDLADLMADRGDFEGCAKNMDCARDLIFRSKNTAQPEVAARNENTGCCGAISS